MLLKLALFSLYFLHTSMVQSKVANYPVDDDSTDLSIGLWNDDKPGVESLDYDQKNHSRIYGERRDGDSLLYTETVAKKIRSTHPLQVFHGNIKFPVKGTTNNKTINFISILDNKADGFGGRAFYKRGGGVGFKQVVIHCWSFWGFNFTAEIYGFDDNDTNETLTNSIESSIDDIIDN